MDNHHFPIGNNEIARSCSYIPCYTTSSDWDPEYMPNVDPGPYVSYVKIPQSCSAAFNQCLSHKQTLGSNGLYNCHRSLSIIMIAAYINRCLYLLSMCRSICRFLVGSFFCSLLLFLICSNLSKSFFHTSLYQLYLSF